MLLNENKAAISNSIISVCSNMFQVQKINKS